MHPCLSGKAVAYFEGGACESPSIQMHLFIGGLEERKLPGGLKL